MAPDVTTAEDALSKVNTVISDEGCVAKREVNAKEEVEWTLAKRQEIMLIINIVITVVEEVANDVGSVPQAQKLFQEAEEELVVVLEM